MHAVPEQARQKLFSSDIGFLSQLLDQGQTLSRISAYLDIAYDEQCCRRLYPRFVGHFDLILLIYSNENAPIATLRLGLQQINNFAVPLLRGVSEDREPEDHKYLGSCEVTFNFREFVQRIELAAYHFLKETRPYDLLRKNCQDFITLVLGYLTFEDTDCLVGSMSQHLSAWKKVWAIILRGLGAIFALTFCILLISISSASFKQLNPFYASPYDCYVTNISLCSSNHTGCMITSTIVHGQGVALTYTGPNCKFEVYVNTSAHNQSSNFYTTATTSNIFGGCKNVPYRNNTCCQLKLNRLARCTIFPNNTINQILSKEVFAVDKPISLVLPGLIVGGVLLSSTLIFMAAISCLPVLWPCARFFLIQQPITSSWGDNVRNICAISFLAIVLGGLMWGLGNSSYRRFVSIYWLVFVFALVFLLITIIVIVSRRLCQRKQHREAGLPVKRLDQLISRWHEYTRALPNELSFVDALVPARPAEIYHPERAARDQRLADIDVARRNRN